MRKAVLRSLSLTAVCAILLACSAKSTQPTPSIDEDQVTYSGLQLNVANTASPRIQALATAVSAAQAVSFRTITEMLVERHQPQNPALLAQKLKDLLAPNHADLNPRQLKISYEQKLSEKNGGKKLIYNRAKTNLADIVDDNRMQCYSGTYLYQWMRRQRGAGRFRAGQEVVILESGHIRPGYFETRPDGRYLIGIETTKTAGAATTVAVINAQNRSLGLRLVVDAELFALAELTQDHLQNKAEVAKAMLEMTAKKYDFDLPEIKSTSAEPTDVKMLNQSIFAFGSANVPDGDLERSESTDDGSNEIQSEAPESKFSGGHVETNLPSELDESETPTWAGVSRAGNEIAIVTKEEKGAIEYLKSYMDKYNKNLAFSFENIGTKFVYFCTPRGEFLECHDHRIEVTNPRVFFVVSEQIQTAYDESEAKISIHDLVIQDSRSDKKINLIYAVDRNQLFGPKKKIKPKIPNGDLGETLK